MTTTPRILVVDDSINLRKLIVHGLKRCGSYQVVEATNGLDGIRRAKEQQFDLIITGVDIPKLDAYRFIPLARDIPSNRSIPILVVTKPLAEDDIQRLKVAGTTAIIEKPMTFSSFAEKITQLLTHL